MAGVNALPSVASAQQSMSYQQWAGPPVNAEADVQVTSAGVTQWGYTMRLTDRSTGYTAVFWQAYPGAPWQAKGSDGDYKVFPPELFAETLGIGAPAYRAPAPVYNAPTPPRSPGYSTANYGWTSWRWIGR